MVVCRDTRKIERPHRRIDDNHLSISMITPYSLNGEVQWKEAYQCHHSGGESQTNHRALSLLAGFPPSVCQHRRYSVSRHLTLGNFEGVVESTVTIVMLPASSVGDQSWRVGEFIANVGDFRPDGLRLRNSLGDWLEESQVRYFSGPSRCAPSFPIRGAIYLFSI